MAINFPDSPSTGQVFTVGTKTWTYNGSSWVGANYGSADTLDGIDSTQFLRSDQSDTMSGNLTVSGEISTTGQLTIDGFTGNNGLSFRQGFSPSNVGIRAKAITTSNRDGLELLGYNGIDFTINNGDTVAMHINGQGIGASAGNVGIGAASPATALHISSSGANAYSSTITRGSNHKGITVTQSNNTNDMVGIFFATGTNSTGSHWSGITGSRSNYASDWATQLNFYTHDESLTSIDNATQKMVIKGNGNVGIGITNPSEKLHVAGDLRVGSGAQRLYLYDDGNAHIHTTADPMWLNAGNNSNIYLNGQTSGNVSIGKSSNNGAKLDVGGSITADSSVTASNLNAAWLVGGTGQTYSANRDTKISAGNYVYSSYSGGSGAPTTYDIALQVPNYGRAMEFSASWISSTAGPLYFRTLRDCCINWSSWSQVSMSTVSDRRVKDNVVKYTAQEARTLIEKLQAVEYDYVNQDGTKGIVDEEEPDAALIPRPREIGYIAQDIIRDVPFVVGYNKHFDQENEHGWASAYTVDYERLVPVLSEALKDVYKTLDETTNKLTAAESKISNLEERLLLAESRIERIINGEL